MRRRLLFSSTVSHWDKSLVLLNNRLIWKTSKENFMFWFFSQLTHSSVNIHLVLSSNAKAVSRMSDVECHAQWICEVQAAPWDLQGTVNNSTPESVLFWEKADDGVTWLFHAVYRHRQRKGAKPGPQRGSRIPGVVLTQNCPSCGKEGFFLHSKIWRNPSLQ